MSNHQPTIERHLRDILQQEEKLRLDTVRWLRNGLDEHMQTGEPLERCLGIGRANYLRAQRDQYLTRAWQIVDETATPWGRCLLLETEIFKFETRVWCRWKDYDKPDSTWSDLRKNIFSAFRYSQGVTMPNSANQIKNIVKSSGMYIS